MNAWRRLRERSAQRDAEQHFARPAEWAPSSRALADLGVAAADQALFGTDIVAGAGPGAALLRTEPDRPVLVLGPTGAGKTTAVNIPAILEACGSVLATSTSRDVLERTLGWRAQLGPVYVFGPSVQLDEPAHRYVRPWTPLVGCLDAVDQPSWSAALRTGQAMVSAAQNGAARTGSDAFWGAKAAELLALVLWAVICEDAAHRADPSSDAGPGTMRAVLTLIARIQLTSGAAALQEAVKATGHAVARLLATSILTLPPPTLGGICATAMQTLAAYLYDDVADAPVAACLRPAQLLDTRATLYILGSGPAQAAYRPIYTALLSSLLHLAEERADASPGGRLPIPLLLAIDEAGTVASVPELARLTATVRKAGIRLLTCWHDIAQLEDRYGQAQAGTILSNAGSVLILPGLTDQRSCSWVEGAFGLREVIDESTSASTSTTKGEGTRSTSRQTSTSRSISRLPLVPAGSVPTMPPGHLLALIGPHRLTLRQRRWYDRQELRDRAALADQPSGAPSHADGSPRLRPRPGR